MVKILDSKKFVIGSLIFAILMWSFAYLAGFTYVGLDTEAYNRGEEIPTIGLGYYGKITFGGYSSPLPEALTFQTEDGRVLSADEMVKFINPELNPYVEDGRVYLYTEEWSYWGKRIYWTSANPATTNIAKVLQFIRGF